ncbi:hypothetical protein OESDEN_14517 [Oesophagostomum dentatum]|uniref:Histidine triad domain protein n=1 Tax=Oesophagostomum dentatum TaxID=61180 RepID=A0A0B1SKA0_OESDE|nr:hypothetical protein OESDEN_14517 [Oesophagostomum dentatum]
MLRVGFHWPPLITINHLHMHILYPIRELGFFSRNLIFRPGKVFRTTSEVIEDLRKAANIPDPLHVMDMEKTGREFLRAELKAKGEADTVEDMLRVGFHWPPLITINHLHMHILYPIRELGFFSRNLIFRPGKVFRTTSEVIEDLRKAANIPDPLHANPAKDDEPEALPAHAVAN